MAEETKRIRRTREEMIAEIDKKIAFHEDKIAHLNDKKEKLKKPRAVSDAEKQEKFKELIAAGKLTTEEAVSIGFRE